MSGNLFGRTMAVLVCVAAVATAWDAEAGPRHRRRCCADPCCEPVCYQPACAPACCETTWAPSCCGSSFASYHGHECCGRIVWHRDTCCERVVSATIVVPAAPCCASTESQTAVAMTLAAK